jgi:hypothetical protein
MYDVSRDFKGRSNERPDERLASRRWSNLVCLSHVCRTGIENVPSAWAGWGPRLDELDFTGGDPLPDMMTFVETQMETFAPAFPRRPGPGIEQTR